MNDMQRTHFFRPWNCVSENEDGDGLEVEEISSPFNSIITNISTNIQNHNIKEEQEEEDDSESVISSSCSSRNYITENYFVSKRSYSINSEDADLSTLKKLSSFVLNSNEKNEFGGRRHLRNSVNNDRYYERTNSVIDWNNITDSTLLYPSTMYEYSGYQNNWPIQNMYINSIAGLSTNYTWLSTNYQSINEAVNRLNHQDAVAKHIKKLRPKKFRCHYCDIAFSNNGQLKGHLRIHTGERPFKCDIEDCGKSFTRNEELTRHKRIHTGLRPYSCLICRKGFGRKDHLKKHTKTHDNRNIYLTTDTITAAATPFPGFHFIHNPSISAMGIPYLYSL